MPNIEIIPAVLPTSFDELREKLKIIATFAKSAQLDVVDGMFDDNITWPYVRDEQWSEVRDLKIVRETTAPQLFLEAHLMVQKPHELGHALIQSGVRRVIAHAEVFPSPHDIGECIHGWRVAGAEVGIALLLNTPLERVGAIIKEVDVVQVMGIAEIGAQGHAFDPRALDRVRELRLAYPKLTIGVDGGVNERNIHGLMLAGVNRCAVGSAIVKAVDPARAYTLLQEAVV